MSKRIKTISPFVVFTMIMILYHILLKESPFGDAKVYFNKVLDDYTLLEYYSYRWNNLTSRLVIETFLIVLARYEVIWRVLDTLIWLLLAHSTAYLLPSKNKFLNNCLSCSLWLIYPFWQMSSAGFIATTMNYTWPLAFGLFSLRIVVKLYNNGRINIGNYLLCLLALVFAANMQQTAVFMLLLYAAAIVVFIKNRKPKKQILQLCLPLLIIIAEIVLAMICPGTEGRTQFEIPRWFPEWSSVTFLEKIKLGFVSTFSALQQSFSALYGFLLLLLLYLAITRIKTKWSIIVSIIPCAFYGYYSIINLKNNRFHAFYNSGIDKANASFELSLIGLLQALIILTCVSALIYYIAYNQRSLTNNDSKRMAVFLLLLLLFGGVSRIIMGFSPTIYASSDRTMLTLYVVIIYIIAVLIEMSVYTDNSKTKSDVLVIEYGLTAVTIISVMRTMVYFLFV